MASATNLLGLVNQLQNLEVSFSKILMETAMKLSALTDLNVFVLVETQDGRRFSGKRHLCDAYIDGSLTLQGSDVEFEINPSVYALRQRSHHQRSPRRSSPQRRNLHSRRSPGASSTPQRSPKRSGSTSGAGPTSAKRRRSYPTTGDAELDGSGEAERIDLTSDAGLNHLNSSGETSISSRIEEDSIEARLKFDPEALMEADVVETEMTDGQLDEQTGEMRASALVSFNGVAENAGRRRKKRPDICAEPTEIDDVAPCEANGIVSVLSSPRGSGGGGGILDGSAKSLVDIDLEDCDELNRQLMDSLPHTLVSKLEGLSQFQSGPNLIPGSTEFRLLNR